MANQTRNLKVPSLISGLRCPKTLSTSVCRIAGGFKSLAYYRDQLCAERNDHPNAFLLWEGGA